MGRVIVISGASSGLGKAIIEGIIQYNDTIYCIGRSKPYLNIEADGVTVHHIKVDYKSPASVVDQLVKEGVVRCDLLLNCAGYMPLEDSFLLYDLKQEFNILDVNLMTHYLVTKHFIQGAMDDCCKLNIISIASCCGVKADSETPLYAAAKAGIIALTEGLCTFKPELVRINCISPGYFNTNLVPGDAPQELLDAQVPQKREARPEEIVPVVKMILDSPFMTGSNIIIDGGQVRK
jgi:NAD(P)-dependent dehydrogenase (short-subunit alcohol dehydrogenase family)